MTASSAGRTTGALRRSVLCLTLTATVGLLAGCGRSGGDDTEVAGTSSVVSSSTTTATIATTTEAPPPPEVTYVVQPGDSLSLIAERFGVGTQALADFNAITDANDIQVGQELRIPPADPAGTTATSDGADESTTETSG